MMALAQKVIQMDDHRPDGPQLENGFVRVANELEDALLAKIRTFRHSQVVRAIIRKTYGYGKKEDDISLSQIAEMTGLQRSHVSVALRELEQMRVINAIRPGKFGQILGLNKHHSQWETDVPKTVTQKAVPETVTTCSQNGNDAVPVSVQNRNQNGNNKRQLQKTTPKEREKGGKPAAQVLPTPPDWMPAELWADFVSCRKEAGKAMTVTAAKRMLAKIERLKADGHCPAKLLENSIINRWTDVYPKPETLAGKPGKAGHGKPMAGLYGVI